MDRIIIQEVDNTSNVEALSSYDVVYVPGFSLNGASPVMTEGEESLFRNPRLVTSKYEFKRLYGDQCPTFETDQLYPVATTAANGFPSYAIPGFVPPGEPTEVANVATVAYTNVPSTDADRVALIQGEANYYTKTIFSETEDTQVAPEGWEPDPEVTYYEAIFDDTNHLATMKALKADATSGYEGKFVFESSVSPVELAWRILYNGRYIATDDEEIGFTLLGEANDAVKTYYAYEAAQSPAVMFYGPTAESTGDPDPGYRYALYLLSLGIPVYYEQMNSDFVEVDMNDITMQGLNPFAEGWFVQLEDGKYVRTDDQTVHSGVTYYLGADISVDSMYDGLERRFFFNTDDDQADYTFDSQGDYAVKYITSGGYPTFEYGPLDVDGEYGTSGLAENMIRLASRRADAIALIDHTDNPNRSIYATDTYSVIARVRDEFTTFTEEQGSFGAMFTPWYKCTHTAVIGGTSDLYTSEGFMPASLAYLSALSQQLMNYNPWLAVSGVHRGVVPYFGKLHTNYTLTNNVADSYQIVPGDSVDSTSAISINPITYIRNYGYCIWGNRTLRNNTSGTKSSSFLNIRNLVSDIKKALYNACLNLMFEQNTDLLWIDFKSIITPLLESMVSNYIIGSYSFTRYLIDPENGQPVPSYKVLANLRITPINSVEVFDLTVTLENSEIEVTETA